MNDLLLLARADAGRALAKEPVDVSALLEETCRQARQLDSQREIQLHAPTSLNSLGDKDALKQVLLIALDNALKHVFDRFYRGDDESTIPGFGLGLPIARALVKAQGGEILMESNAGTGSTVILRFYSTGKHLPL